MRATVLFFLTAISILIASIANLAYSSNSSSWYLTSTDTCFDAMNIDSFLDCPEIDNAVSGHMASIVQEPFDWSLIEDLNSFCTIDTSSGVWLEFNATNNDIAIDNNLGNNLQVLLINNSCDSTTIVFCDSLPISDVFAEPGNNALVIGEPYLLYLCHPDGLQDSFNICIDNDGMCSQPAVYAPSYCQTEPICELSDLDNYCISMQANLFDESWPGCSVFIHDPNWFTFIAGSDNMTIEVQIGNCLIGNGVQFELYEIDWQGSYGPAHPFCPASDLSPPLLNCIFSETPQLPGSNPIIMAPTQAGQMYGFLVDGWGGDLCELSFNVLSGGGTIDVTGLFPPSPTFDQSKFPYDGDTICVGSHNVLFTADPLLGLDYYSWTIDSMPVPNGSLTSEVSMAFPDTGTFEICVQIDNSCTQSEQSCIEVVVVPHEHQVLIIDTAFFCASEIFIDALSYNIFDFSQSINWTLPNSTIIQSNSFEIAEVGQYILNTDHCPDTIIINVSEGYNIEADITYQNCAEASIELSTVGLVDPQYLWSTGETTEHITQLSFGYYYVTISDTPRDCSFPLSYFIAFSDSCHSSIVGQVLIQDTVECGTNKPKETGVNQHILIEPGGLVISSGEQGVFDVDLPPGNYTLSPVLHANQIAACPPTLSISVDTPGLIIDTVQFCVLDTTYCMMELQAAAGIARPGRYIFFCTEVQNVGVHSIRDVRLVGAFDSFYQVSNIIEIDTIESINNAENEITWKIDKLNPGQSEFIDVKIWLSAQVNVGTILENYFSVMPECASRIQVNQEVFASYDPNDKTLMNTIGRSSTNILRSDSTLDYVIRFQNTGNDTAFRVVITDQLSDNLDYLSFNPGPSSHDYTWRILYDRIVEFTFDPIELPYKSIDEEGSQGFVSFSIDRIPELMLEDEILNNANIFFDFNAPVLTNTVTSVYFRPQLYQTMEFTLCPGDTFMDVQIFEYTEFERTVTYFDFDSIYQYNVDVLATDLTEIDTTVLPGTILFGNTITMDTLISIVFDDTDHDCDSIVNYNVEVISSTYDIFDSSIYIHPNPAKDIILISSNSPISHIEVFDRNGRIILNSTGNNTTDHSVDVSNIPPGLYLLHVTTIVDRNVKKFVKM